MKEILLSTGFCAFPVRIMDDSHRRTFRQSRNRTNPQRQKGMKFKMLVGLILLTGLCSIACAFFAGLYAGTVFKPSAAGNDRKDEKPDNVVKLSEDQKHELQRRQRELMNFFNYNGDEMPDSQEK